MDFLNKYNKKILLIVEPDMKEKLLEEISIMNSLLDIKFMSLEAFLEHYLFTYTVEANYYVSRKYEISANNAGIYLDNLKYGINIQLDNEKIKFLKNLYKDLDEKELIIKDPFFKTYLENVQIIVYDYPNLDLFYKKIFDEYHADYINFERDYIDKKLNVYSFNQLEDECVFIFNKISSLIKKGTNIKNIKLANISSEYVPYLKRMSKFYQIKINKLEKNNLYGTVVAKEFLNLIKEGKSKEEICDALSKYQELDIYSSLLDIINKYYFTPNLLDVLDFIILELKKRKIKTFRYEEALEIIPINAHLITSDDYVFIMGFNLENVPYIYKDEDYLSDNIKKEIGLLTSYEKNKFEKEKLLVNLSLINNLYITYKESSPYRSYFPSNILDDLNINIIRDPDTINETSSLYNKIKLVDNLDLMLKYGIKKKDTGMLFSTYPTLPYLTYDNTFNGLKHFEQKGITLSYTTLNNYYHCSFRYYIDSILKLNIYEDTFKTFIGNLFHDILSKIFKDDFDYEKEFNAYLEKRNHNAKEEFYLEILKEELLYIIEVIKYQHSLSGLTNLLLEQSIVIDGYKNNNFKFKGIIDKIMYKEKNGQTYVSLIDYKTGTPKTDMSNLIYGIDIQLPVYLYLVKKSKLFSNLHFTGFYLQQIVHEKISLVKDKDLKTIKKDSLRLNGYSIKDEYLVNMFDATYQNSELIKGMKITSKGFSHYTKVLTEDEIDEIINIVDKKIEEAFNLISEGNFIINPKIIGGENIGCQFCQYQDLCFKTGKDLVYLDKKDNLVSVEVGDINA